MHAACALRYLLESTVRLRYNVAAWGANARPVHSMRVPHRPKPTATLPLPNELFDVPREA